jgi:hypothetical protein
MVIRRTGGHALTYDYYLPAVIIAPLYVVLLEYVNPLSNDYGVANYSVHSIILVGRNHIPFDFFPYSCIKQKNCFQFLI